MRHFALIALALCTLTTTAQPTIKTDRSGVVTYISTAADPKNPTVAELEAAQVDLDTVKATATAKEATRLTKRPKRSEINSAKSKAANAATLAEAIDALQAMAVLLDKVLDFQKVDVNEDTE